MTGFAQETYADKALQLTVMVRTYNHRFLDINLRLPNLLFPLEERIKSLVASRLSRGRVEVNVQLTSQEKANHRHLTVNWPLAEAYRRLLGQLQERLEVEGPVRLSDLLALKDMIVAQEPTWSEGFLWKRTAPVLKKALTAVERMRLAEGKNLTKDLKIRVQLIRKGAEAIARRAPQVLESYRKRLKERLEAWCPAGGVVDPQRLAQEVAFLADRADISEELVRLDSHLTQFARLMGERQPVGKRMEFLVQEMNREVNTIGAKGMDSDIAHQVVAIKAELEKIREQVQNIE
jgi:uncharacterized protein (TIGR00255 family)